MSLTWHIVLKDLRRLRPWLALLVAAILARYASTLFFASLEPTGYSHLHRWDLVEITDWSLLAVSLCPAIIAAALVHIDPVTGTRAYWLTRPIAPARLLLAKIITIALTLVLLPTLLQLAWWTLHHYGAAEIAAQLPSMLARHAGTAAAAFFFALLTRNLGHFFLSALLCTLAFGAIMAGLTQLSPRSWIVHTKTWPVLMLTIVIIGVVAAILTQYLTRRTRTTVGIVVSIFLLCFAFSALWRSPLFKPTSYFARFPKLNAGPDIALTLQPVTQENYEDYIRTNLSKKNALIFKVTAATIPAGRLLEFSQPEIDKPNLAARIQTSRADLSSSLSPQPTQEPELVTIVDTRSNDKPALEPGQQITFPILLRRAHIIARLPLKTNASSQTGPFSTRIIGFTDESQRVEVAPGVTVRAGGFKSLSVIVRETCPSHLIDPVSGHTEEQSFLQRRFSFSPREGYLLVRDNQVVSAISRYKGGMDGNPTSTDGVQYDRLTLRFSGLVITDADLARYELVRVVTPAIGTFECAVTIPSAAP